VNGEIQQNNENKKNKLIKDQGESKKT